MKQFDDRFRENVEKAFNNYEAGHLADEGWNAFLERRKGHGRRLAAWFPAWLRAASVLLVIGLGLYFAHRVITKPGRMENLSGHYLAGNGETETIGTISPEVPLSSITGQTTDPELVSGNGNEMEEARLVLQAMEGASTNLTSFIIDTTRPSEEMEERRFSSSGIPGKISPLAIHELSVSGTFNDTDLSSRLPVEFVDGEKTIGKGRSYPGSILMAGLSGSFVQNAGTVSPSSGLSAGIFLDQKVTRKISVRPGLTLALQSFGFENKNWPGGSRYAMYLMDGIKGEPHSYSGQFNMLAMEIPMNLVFRLFEKGMSELYLTAGASSIIYLRQHYRADFVNELTRPGLNPATGEMSPETRLSTVEVENHFGAFSRSDFLGLANLSAGYSFPYSKTGTILIEPFIQLPVSQLTSLNLKVRYSGISFKLSLTGHSRE